MPPPSRFAKLNIICGAPGTGKSTLMDNIIKVTHFSKVLVYIEPEDGYGQPYKDCKKQSLYEYRGGKAAISSDEIKFEPFIQQVADNYRNGMLVFDEAGLYGRRMFDNRGDPIEPLMKILKQRRKFNVEIYMLYHSVAEIPVHLFYWTNNVVLFHQTAEFKHKAGVIPRIDEMKAMQERIRKKYFAGQHYYAEVISLS